MTQLNATTEKSVRDSGKLSFRELPVCRYSLVTEHEKHIYSKREFLRIYRDMTLLRECYILFSELAAKGEYYGTAARLTCPLPAAGEEAIAVGTAYCMEKGDLLFDGTSDPLHILARALAAIEKTNDRDLVSVMKEHLDGQTLGPVAERADNTMTIRELAVNFFLYGMISELFGKKTGFSRGLSGNDVSFPAFGSFPAPEGAMALGASLAVKGNAESRFVVSHLGKNADFDTMRLAKRGITADAAPLPVLFTVTTHVDFEEANMDDHTLRMGAGIAPDALHAERVDGTSPMAVIDAVARKKEIIERGEGPVLIEFITHQKSDAKPTRKSYDPVVAYREKLLQGRIASETELHELDLSAKRRITELAALAANDEISPRLSPAEVEAVFQIHAEDEHRTPSLYPNVMRTKESLSRTMQIAMKERFGYAQNGEPISKTKRYNLADAVFEPILARFYDDPAFLVSHDEKDPDGVLSGIREAIPAHRLLSPDLSPASLLAASAGYALAGGRAAIALSSAEELLAAEKVLTALSALRLKSGGTLKLPLVIRVPVNKNEGEIFSTLCGIPALKVLYPATPFDMKGMLSTALRENEPIILFENRRLYDIGECFYEAGVPDIRYYIPMGTADSKKEGKELSILAIGTALYKAIEAADLLSEQYGMNAEVIDARSLVPFDYETLLRSVKKTGKLVIVGDSAERASLMRDIASNVSELAFDMMDAPPVVVGARNLPISSQGQAKAILPSTDTILDAIHTKIMPLAGYTPTADFSAKERLRLTKLGL